MDTELATSRKKFVRRHDCASGCATKIGGCAKNWPRCRRQTALAEKIDGARSRLETLLKQIPNNVPDESEIQTLDVTIMGRTYRSRAPRGRERASLGGGLSRSEMSEIKSAGRVASAERIAVMGRAQHHHELLSSRNNASGFDIEGSGVEWPQWSDARSGPRSVGASVR